MTQPREFTRRPSGWVPGEMHVAVHVDLPGDTSPADAVARVRRVTAEILSDIRVAGSDRQAPPLVIPTRANARHLLFVPITLESEAAGASALLRLGQNGGLRPIEPPEPFDIRDHGLFVAGVVLAT